MILVASFLVSFGCILASARRMWLAASPTALDPDEVVAWLGRLPDRAKVERLRERIESEPSAEWERDLLDAVLEPRPDVRVARVNEQLTELDFLLHRWSRVPRVCASIATSVGILLGTLVLRNALASATDLTGELGELFVRDVVNDAITVASVGVVGTAFCIAAHAHAGRFVRARLTATDRMIERLEEGVGKDDEVDPTSNETRSEGAPSTRKLAEANAGARDLAEANASVTTRRALGVREAS